MRKTCKILVFEKKRQDAAKKKIGSNKKKRCNFLKFLKKKSKFIEKKTEKN